MPNSSDKDSDRVRVIVTSSQPLSTSLPQMRDAGLQVEHTLDAIGIVTGSVPRSRLADLSSLSGTSVELDAGVHIAPPESPIQ